jgi:hypothetical protein
VIIRSSNREVVVKISRKREIKPKKEVKVMVVWWFRATSTQLRGSPQRKPPLAVLRELKKEKDKQAK